MTSNVPRRPPGQPNVWPSAATQRRQVWTPPPAHGAVRPDRTPRLTSSAQYSPSASSPRPSTHRHVQLMWLAIAALALGLLLCAFAVWHRPTTSAHTLPAVVVLEITKGGQ